MGQNGRKGEENGGKVGSFVLMAVFPTFVVFMLICFVKVGCCLLDVMVWLL